MAILIKHPHAWPAGSRYPFWHFPIFISRKMKTITKYIIFMVHHMDHNAHVPQLYCIIGTSFSDEISYLFFSCLFISDNKLIEAFLIESDFYNWNRVKIRYCDGASFAGNAKFDNGVILFHLKFRF